MKEFYIRPAEMSDYPFMIKWGNQHGLRKQMLTRKPTNALEQKAYLEKTLSNPYREILCVCKGKAMRAGVCEIYNIDFQNRGCYINLYIENEEEVLAIYGFDILKGILSYIYQKLGLYKVSVELLLENKSYITLYRHLGFSLELTRPSHRYEGGGFKAVVELALFKNTFEETYGR